MGTFNTLQQSAQLKHDRRNTDQNQQIITLLTALLAEQKRTNQLIEWQGQHNPLHVEPRRPLSR